MNSEKKEEVVINITEKKKPFIPFLRKEKLYSKMSQSHNIAVKHEEKEENSIYNNSSSEAPEKPFI